MNVNWSYTITAGEDEKLEVENLLIANAQLNGGIISLPIYKHKHLETKLLSMDNNGKVYDHINGRLVSL